MRHLSSVFLYVCMYVLEPETGALGASARGRADTRWVHTRNDAVRIPGEYTHAPEHPSHGRVQLKAGSKPTGRRRRGSPAGDAAERKEAKDPPLVRANARRHSDKGGGHHTAPRAVELSHRVRLCQTPSSTPTERPKSTRAPGGPRLRAPRPQPRAVTAPGGPRGRSRNDAPGGAVRPASGRAPCSHCPEPQAR